jgi:hypothetical protein
MTQDANRLERIEAALEQLVLSDRRLYERQQATAENLDRLSRVVDALTASMHREPGAV